MPRVHRCAARSGECALPTRNVQLNPASLGRGHPDDAQAFCPPGIRDGTVIGRSDPARHRAYERVVAIWRNPGDELRGADKADIFLAMFRRAAHAGSRPCWDVPCCCAPGLQDDPARPRGLSDRAEYQTSGALIEDLPRRVAQSVTASSGSTPAGRSRSRRRAQSTLSGASPIEGHPAGSFLDSGCWPLLADPDRPPASRLDLLSMRSSPVRCTACRDPP